MNNKVEALQYTRSLINETITIISNNISSNKTLLNINDVYSETIIYDNTNEETTTLISEIYKGQKSKIISENEFKRIICLEGKLKIIMPQFDEEVIMSSLNTILIPPNTEYIIEVLEDSQIIGILKPKKIVQNTKTSKKTIYSKVLNNE